MNDETQERTFNRLMVLLGAVAVMITISSCASGLLDAYARIRLAELGKGAR